MQTQRALVASLLAAAVLGGASCRWVDVVDRGGPAGVGGHGSGVSGSSNTSSSGGVALGGPWPMLGHDATRTARASTNPDVAPGPGWTLSLGGASISSPVIAQDG